MSNTLSDKYPTFNQNMLFSQHNSKFFKRFGA